jgi:twitching motility protein PilJ
VLNVRNRIQFADDRDARQQQAILGLLDEITNLADGDLTVDGRPVHVRRPEWMPDA